VVAASAAAAASVALEAALPAGAVLAGVGSN